MIHKQNIVIAMGQKYKGKMFPFHTPSILQIVLGGAGSLWPCIIAFSPLFGGKLKDNGVGQQSSVGSDLTLTSREPFI
jgi:hypothetical protein